MVGPEGVTPLRKIDGLADGCPAHILRMVWRT